MIQNLEKRRFRVIKPLALNETDRLMKPGEEGFAYVPLTDPVELMIDAVEGCTVDRKTFEASIEWRDAGACR